MTTIVPASRTPVRWTLAFAIGLVVSFPASAQNLRMLVSWPPGNPAHSMAQQFQRIVDEVGKGKVKIQLIGPEVVPPFQQLQPVTAGAFDLLYTAGAYHGGNKGLAMVMDVIAPDPTERRKSGVMAFLDNYYQKEHRIKVLGVDIMGHAGYQCVLKAPLTPQGDWKGRKIRGVSSFHGVIQALGGSPVNLPVAESYSALEKGVVDGSCMPGGTVASFKLYEVVKYRVEPTFGTANLIFGINLNKWNSLSKEAQSILIEAGERTEPANLALGDTALKEEREELTKHGVQVQQVPAPLAGEMLKAFDESNWALGDRCCGETAKQLRAVAVKGGLAK